VIPMPAFAAPPPPRLPSRLVARRPRCAPRMAAGPPVMVNGLPGRMAEAVAEAVVRRGHT